MPDLPVVSRRLVYIAYFSVCSAPVDLFTLHTFQCAGRNIPSVHSSAACLLNLLGLGTNTLISVLKASLTFSPSCGGSYPIVFFSVLLTSGTQNT
jgi:hypothetical protein